jgi:hypothetical protein
MRTKNIGAAKRRPPPEAQKSSEIEQAVEAPSVNGLQLDSDAPATDIQSAEEPETPLTDPDVPTAAAVHDQVVTPEAPPTAEMRSDPDATTLPVEYAEKYSLADAWAWADRVQREAFVVEHRAELQKILKKIERKKTELQ